MRLPLRKPLVFLSCGQRGNEKKIAEQIVQVVKASGFDCYCAESMRGFYEMRSILDNLAAADYYLFIDFERPSDPDKVPLSVFTHQELALAWGWGFENLIAFKQGTLKSHGILGYVLAHPIKFDDPSELPALVRRAIKDSGWTTDFSRNLVPVSVSKTPKPVHFAARGEAHKEWIWTLTIANRRPDRAAVDTIAVLHSFRPLNKSAPILLSEPAYLKWAGLDMGFNRTILPESSGTLDIFATRVGEEGLFLHSASDVYPRRAVINKRGTYELTFRIFAKGFPIVDTKLKVNYHGGASKKASGIRRVTIIKRPNTHRRGKA